MSLTLKTPGVYIEEKSAFSNSVVAVATAIPAFIGYTENAMFKGKSLLNKPIKVDSLLEFENFFGKGAQTVYNIAPVAEGDDASEVDLIITDKQFTVTPQDGTLFYMYESIKLFYANGGSTCYIISVGTYGGGTTKPDISSEPFEGGIKLLEKEVEPTIVLIPDALLLSDNNGANCYALQQQILSHCGTFMNRVGILDVFKGDQGLDDPTYNPIDAFRNSVSSDFLSYGAAYYPWLNTTIVQPTELSFENLSPESITVLQGLLTDSIEGLDEKQKEALTPYISAIAGGEPEEGSDVPTDKSLLNTILNNTFPIYKSVMGTLLEKKNVLPPSGAMAGIYARVDNDRGVWKAPANVAVNSVTGPVIHIDHDQQQDLNAPILGKAICAIRPFIGLGTMVWGARTLDANSLDWRYINVRRTIIMIEQSIKFAAQAYVFEPNVKNTWVAINSMITSFLTNMWKQGALAGSVPEDAFEVGVGLGATMSSEDILEGIMRISVKLAISRPAEFIVITFQQQMQKS